MGKVEGGVIVDLLHTDRVLGNIKLQYDKLAKPQFGTHYKIIPETLRDLLDEFTPILAREKGFDKEGITNLIFYAAHRLPEEIYTGNKDIVIRFDDDPNFFIDENGKKVGVTKPNSRNRFHKVETIKDETNQSIDKTLITIHAQSQTAVIETFTHLALVEILRQKIKEIFEMSTAEDILSDDHARFLQELVSLVTNNPMGEKDHVEKLRAWSQREIVIEQNPGMAIWDELITTDKTRSKTASKLAEKARTKLERMKPPDILMFSNSFSLPNLLSHYLLNEEKDSVTLRQHIKDKALEAWKLYIEQNFDREKTVLEILGESITGLDIYQRDLSGGNQQVLDENTKNFIIDNFIVFDLGRRDPDSLTDPIINKFIKDFQDPQRIARLGILTVIKADKSPTAEPLYYIDFSKMDDEVINQSNPLLQETFRKLKTEGLVALYTPYLPGDLTYSTILEMHQRFSSIKGIVEIGKVATMVTSEQQRNFREIGQMVIPTESIASYGDTSKKKFKNQIKKIHARLFDQLKVVFESVLMNVPSVVLQHAEEMVETVNKHFKDNLHKTDVTINMEIGPIVRAINKLYLLLFEVDYISDHAISPKLLKILEGLSTKKVFQGIEKSLGRQGIFAVAAATATALRAVAESKGLYKKIKIVNH